MSSIFNNVELLTVSYMSDHIVHQNIENINEKFKITIVENSNNVNFKLNIEKKKNINCILAGENIGFGSAFNLGAKSIKSKYILHFNPDAMINDEVIESLYNKAEKTEFGIISVKESDHNTGILNNTNSLIEVDSVKGFVMFVKNSALKKVDYFDENIFLYLEEIDLCRRLKKVNQKIFLDENIVVKHIGGKSHDPMFNDLMELQRNWHYMWSLFYFTKKHKNLFHAYKITLRKFISAIGKCLIYYFLNKKKYKIYKHRFLGLFNSYLGKKSFFRIKLSK
tara:strand:+ start:108 stop:947 length:840 start_codon:yes stop_codon:yes gene_type:complete